MKNFKNIKIVLVALIAILSFVPTSCVNDLDDTPEGSTTYSADNVFGSDLTKYTQFLSKLYGGLAVSGPTGAGSSDIQGIDSGFGQYIRAYFMMQEVPTDEAILGWTGDAGVIDMSAGTFAPSNPFINAMYQRIMYQIGVCNEFLRQTTPDKLSDRGVSAADQATIDTYRAETRFLRALSYWHGLDIFGKMSFVTEADPVSASFKPAEISKEDLFAFIESELIACTPSMKTSLSNESGRADQAAAWMLLAKLYLNAEVYTGTARYADCLTYTNQVLNSGYIVNTGIPYNYLFMADNDTNGSQSETIFAAQSDGITQQSYGGTTFLIHAAIGGTMDPVAFGVDGGWAGLRTRPEFVNKFGTNDIRGVFHTDGQNLNIASMGTFTDGYGITKFKNVTSNGAAGSNATFADTDFPLFRTAEAYLMYAELAARGTGGATTNQAVTYVNTLRTRANEADFTTADITLDKVLDERARELYWEGHRRTDLIRFGKFTGNSYTWQWKGNSQAGTSINSTNSVMPIPTNVLSANSNLTQNSGY